MRILQSSIFRAVVAIAIGALLIKYPDNTATGITIAIGVLFLLSGLVSVLTYFNARKHVSEYTIYDAQGRQVAGSMPTFPVVGLGSIILGLILAITPNAFIAIITYIIGIVIVLGAITQFTSLIAARHFGPMPFWAWLFPSLTFIFGAYLMLRPLDPASMTMYALGWLSLFYGVTEAVNALRIYTTRRRFERENPVPEAEEVFEEVSSEPTTDAEPPTEAQPIADEALPVAPASQPE